jgi:mannose-6-phosphate isomerase-like protein (cupin superfamily)
MIFRPAGQVQAFRISPADTNYFACLFDPIAEGAGFTMVVEIFAPGGATPPNTHGRAQEVFYVLHGQGVAVADGVEQPISQGDCLMLKPGTEHVVRNPGPWKLYCLTMMVPDEDFAALIRAGSPVELDAEDVAILSGTG